MSEKKVTETANTALSIEELKAKYGLIYKIGVNITIDDDTEKSVELIFKKPTANNVDRFIKRASDSTSKAAKNLVYDCIIEEYKEKLDAALEEYPGCALTFAEKLMSVIGGTGETNLKLL